MRCDNIVEIYKQIHTTWGYDLRVDVDLKVMMFISWTYIYLLICNGFFKKVLSNHILCRLKIVSIKYFKKGHKQFTFLSVKTISRIVNKTLKYNNETTHF